MAAKVLKKYKIDIKILEKQVKELYRDRTPLSNNVAVDYSPKVKNILKTAESIAYGQNSNYIFTEHLLYAILLEPTSFAYQILVEFDFIISNLLEDVEEVFDFDLL